MKFRMIGLGDSPFSDNLNRIDIRSSYDRYDFQILYSHITLNLSSVTMFSRPFLNVFCLFFLSSYFFQPPLFSCIL